MTIKQKKEVVDKEITDTVVEPEVTVDTVVEPEVTVDTVVEPEVTVDTVVEINSEYQALLETYKIQNPVKYELKKDELLKRLNK